MLWPCLQLPMVRRWVAPAADVLLAHLSLLFVPVGVGVIVHLDLLAGHGVRLVVVLVLSTWVGLAVTAWVLRALLARAGTGATPTPPGDPP
jgi:holin-like protein